jgi:hypothetical protein
MSFFSIGTLSPARFKFFGSLIALILYDSCVKISLTDSFLPIPLSNNNVLNKRTVSVRKRLDLLMIVNLNMILIEH